MSKLNFKEMIALWVKITGVDPTEDNKSYTFTLMDVYLIMTLKG